MATGCSTKAKPDPARQPLPVIEQDEPVPAKEAWMIWLVVSCFAVMGAWVFVQYAPHIFKSLASVIVLFY